MDPSPGREHIPSLDGVRGIAILLVLMFHSLLVQEDSLPAAPIYAVAGSGWVGVNLFFVLSGFLITGILLDTQKRRHSLRNFYARRALRILPLYYTALVLFFYVLPREPFPELAWHDDRQILYWTYLQNWAIAALGSWPPVPNLNHLWSLNIEEQFYLVWPLAVFGLGRRRLLWLCGLAIAGCLGLRIFLLLQGTPWISVYVNTFARMDDLAVGAAVACLARGPRGLAPLVPAARILGGACLLYLTTTIVMHGSLVLWDHRTVTIGFSVASLAFGCGLVTILCVSPQSIANRLLSSAPLRTFGKYSYALYVFHLPIVVLLQSTIRIDMPGSVPYLMFLFAVTVLSLLVSLVSWYVIELPFLRLKRYFTDEPDAATGGATAS